MEGFLGHSFGQLTNSVAQDGTTPLHMASTYARDSIARLLVQSKAAIDAVNPVSYVASFT